tara:strand:- start:411 stop:521 length:111 start_codon:yes stop_codon:yes gene_type:complete
MLNKILDWLYKIPLWLIAGVIYTVCGAGILMVLFYG